MKILHTFLDALKTLGQVKPAYAVAAVALYLVGLVCGGARWRKVLAGLGCPTRLVDTTLAILIGIFVNNVTPTSRIGGEVARISLIRKKDGVDFKRATVSIFYDRIATVIPMIFLLILAFPVLRPMIQRVNDIYVIIFGILGVLLAVFAAYRKFPRLRHWIAERVKVLMLFKIELPKLRDAVGFAALVWTQDILRLMVVSAAFGVILNPYQAATLSLVVLLCSFIPSFGGVGPTEGGLTAALHLFGVSIETAIAITILERSISYVFSTCAGSIALAALGGKKLLVRNPERNQALTETI